MRVDPKRIAIEYYFGDLQYWKIPGIAAKALEDGFDGPALRKLAGLANLTRKEIRAEDVRSTEIDSAFCEMGVDAPITEQEAQLTLATESANRALRGSSNVFDEATYIRIHLCHLSEPPEYLRQIVNLSKEAKNAPRLQWSHIEGDLENAFADLLAHQKTPAPE